MTCAPWVTATRIGSAVRRVTTGIYAVPPINVSSPVVLTTTGTSGGLASGGRSVSCALAPSGSRLAATRPALRKLVLSSKLANAPPFAPSAASLLGSRMTCAPWVALARAASGLGASGVVPDMACSLCVWRRRDENGDHTVVDGFVFIRRRISAEAQFAHAAYFLNAHAMHVAVVSCISRARRALGIRNTQCLCPTEVAGTHV